MRYCRKSGAVYIHCMSTQEEEESAIWMQILRNVTVSNASQIQLFGNNLSYCSILKWKIPQNTLYCPKLPLFLPSKFLLTLVFRVISKRIHTDPFLISDVALKQKRAVRYTRSVYNGCLVASVYSILFTDNICYCINFGFTHTLYTDVC